jgi:putative membrane protein
LNRWKFGAGAALAIGLALTIGVALHVGLSGLAKAVDAVGWGGFALYALYSLLVYVPLGLAWWSLAPGVPGRRAVSFVWGRILRESAADVLPLAQVGGLLVGVRSVVQRGIGEAVVVGSLIVDLTTEMAAQVLYTLFGVAMVVATLAHATGAQALISTTVLALLIGTGVLSAFVIFQGRTVEFLARISSRWFKNTRARGGAVRVVLQAIYARPDRLLAGFLLHALSWVASGAGSWLALQLMGARLSFWQVLTLESLLSAVRSVAFMTPGGIGIQEGAYVLVAPLFGLPPESALALSLLKRAKDMVIGVPALLTWQADEGRKLVHRA